MKKYKPNTLLLISSIIGNIYAGILLWDLINNLTTAKNSLYGLGQILGTMITAPQVILTIIGVIFSWIGVSSGMSRNALVAGILYSVSVVFRITELLFILPQMILTSNDTLLCCLCTNEQNGNKIKESLSALFFWLYLISSQVNLPLRVLPPVWLMQCESAPLLMRKKSAASLTGRKTLPLSTWRTALR